MSVKNYLDFAKEDNASIPLVAFSANVLLDTI